MNGKGSRRVLRHRAGAAVMDELQTMMDDVPEG